MPLKPIPAALALCLLSACAARSPRIPGPLGKVGRDAPPVAILRPHQPPAPAQEDEPSYARSSELGDRIADAARYYLKHNPRGFRDDCSGFVMAALDRAGVPQSGSTRTFWDDARSKGITHTRKRPNIGDLVFFDNTYDRNRDKRWNDDLTHIGIVIDVDRDGTSTVAHAGTSKGRATMMMNVKHPDVRSTEGGAVYNDWLRARRSSDPGKAVYLSGELWRGFATMHDERLAGTR